MKTYEEEIAEHIAERLAQMPFPEPKQIVAVKRTPARELLSYHLRKYGISLYANNELRSDESGFVVGKHISADWSEKSIVWIYETHGQYITQILRIGD